MQPIPESEILRPVETLGPFCSLYALQMVSCASSVGLWENTRADSRVFDLIKFFRLNPKFSIWFVCASLVWAEKIVLRGTG